MRNKDGYISEFYCTECGMRGMPIMRKINKQREAGHLKKLYCLNCKKETNHAEIRPFGNYTFEDFKEEYELGRFIEGNRIAIADLVFCSNTNCRYNKNRKCWNANNSYECRHKKI